MSSSDPAPDDEITEVTFGITDTKYPFVGLSQFESCRVTLERILPRPKRTVEYFSISRADPDSVLSHMERYPDIEARMIDRYPDCGEFELEVADTCPVLDLTGMGAIPRDVSSVDGNGRIVVDIDGSKDVQAIVTEFLDAHPSAEMLAKDTSVKRVHLSNLPGVQQELDSALTNRQLEVLETAVDEGYFERPRESTGRDIAAELGITPATFSQHKRIAIKKAIEVLVDNRAI